MRACVAMVVGVILCWGIAAAAELPANEWVQLEEGGDGKLYGSALVYVPALGRVLSAMGVQTRFDRKPIPPYSETTFNFEKRRWENWLPKGKEGWGGVTGPAAAPLYAKGYGSGLRTDKAGNLRPDLRGGTGTFVYHLYAYDSDRKRVLFGVDMEYDPVARSWTKLETKGHPGTPDLPPFKLGKMTAGPAWSQMCYDPVNKEFVLVGGAKTITETGSPGTWVYSPAKNEWRKLTLGDPSVNKVRRLVEKLARKAHAAVAACRNRYYRTELPANAKKKLSDLLEDVLPWRDVTDAIDLVRALPRKVRPVESVDIVGALFGLTCGVRDSYSMLLESVDKTFGRVELGMADRVPRVARGAAAALAVEPPPRCYSPMAYDPTTQKIVMFGGWALDRALGDTWVYDCKTRTWERRDQPARPSARLGHGLVWLPKQKKVVLVGGWVPVARVGCSGFYGRTLVPEAWTYDVAADRWALIKRWEPKKAAKPVPTAFPPPGNSAQTFAADQNDVILTVTHQRYRPVRTWACRINASVVDEAGTKKYGVMYGSAVYAGEQCLPRWWDKTNPPPDPAKVEAELKALPVNKWVRRPAGKLNRLTFAYSTVMFDPDRDEILAFAGGHGTYHGTDVTRYSLSTDRWHTDYAAQFPLTFSGFATGGHYAYGFRPWMGVHPWGGYAYDTVTKKLVLLTGMRTFTFVFDPDAGDFERPTMLLPPGGGGWGTVACATPRGIHAWLLSPRKVPSIWRLDGAAKKWVKLLEGGGLVRPGPDSAGITYDSKRDRLVLLGKGLAGDVLTYGLKAGTLERHTPANKERVAKLGFWREYEYVRSADLVFDMMGLGWDPAKNAWLKLSVDTSELSKPRRGRPRPATATNSQGLVYDARRDLLWAVNGYQNKGVFVLKLDAAKARGK